MGRRIMETIHKVTREFREAETKVKLKECQGIRTRSYQHQDNYVQGDKVWFQYKDGLAWHGPGEVIYHKGNAVFIHSNGDVKKVAACKVKPFELRERIEERKEEKRDEERCPEIIEEENKVENDDKKEEKEVEVEENEDENEVRRDLMNDVIGAEYLQVENEVYFMDYSIFTVEVPVREHGKPEIIEAKNTEIENLKTYETCKYFAPI